MNGGGQADLFAPPTEVDWTRAWGAEHFDAFFHAVHGAPPFPWQSRLAERLLAGGEWPRQLDLPTATGKTAALDIALFHLAAQLARGGERTAPVRIAFVVDRRLIVDDAYNRARKIAETLAAPVAEPVRRVADALLTLAPPEDAYGDPPRPLLVCRLRGGIPREDDWARTPAQPTVLTSTVDQVGSRLLFRGYGVSERMAPIHAGLIGADCLILLDEAHLSRPFEQTLEAVGRLGQGAVKGRPLQWAVMTATPATPSGEAGRFGLEPADLDHRILAPRLTHPKPARLVTVKTGKGGEADDAADEASGSLKDATRRRKWETERVDEVVRQVEAAIGHLQNAGVAAPVVGVVVNRVLRARAVFAALTGGEGREVSLVIGPARSVDRDTLSGRLDVINTGQDRSKLTGVRVVVATQTIEAGVDLDFDGLITEVAALDALRQRFGRLNRAGRDIAPCAAILAHPKGDFEKKGDPVYGMAMPATWARLEGWANETGQVDFAQTSLGPKLEALGEDGRAALLSPKADAPVVMPAYVDLWSQTAPAPLADPEPSLFLHGPARPDPKVRIAWRADLTEDLLGEGFDADGWAGVLEAAPVRTAETVEVSLAAARAWMAALGHDRPRAGPDFADVSASGEEDTAHAGGRPLLRPGRDMPSVVRRASELKPNDLLVAPADYGGCDVWGWAPLSRDPVVDVGEAAARPFRGKRYAVRFTRGRLDAAIAAEGEVAEARLGWSELANALDALPTRGRAAFEGEIERIADRLPARLAAAFRPFRKARTRRGGLVQILRFFAEEDAEAADVPEFVVLAPVGLTDAGREEVAGGEPATEDDRQGSFGHLPLDLLTHSADVQGQAGAFATACGLGAELAEDLALAGWLHDAGKADPRFQAYLGSGDPLLLEPEAVLAKSGRRSRPGDRERAGLPDDWRHEAFSVRLALSNPRLAEAHDPGLVLWLVGAHHGYGRPLFPHVHAKSGEPPAEPPLLDGLVVEGGDEAGPESLAFALPDRPGFDLSGRGGEDLRGVDWAQLYDALKRRYGVWGLAHLEAVLRLADHRASEIADRRAAAQEEGEA